MRQHRSLLLRSMSVPLACSWANPTLIVTPGWILRLSRADQGTGVLKLQSCLGLAMIFTIGCHGCQCCASATPPQFHPASSTYEADVTAYEMKTIPRHLHWREPWSRPPTKPNGLLGLA
ncbi:hypothetical protein B0J15DRAFT_496047 [Fusarium solani]|uniref:Uncharacterized protein n=1 Tax=Fusarium solani TaxID=169388 RepID=A0A9P9H621_FUSSL|nr:uncharacterized protein B0J15DRAFT_496047 [Fusarium solani]KAH7250447.1 hypothetical protein B0J15DRAFT_496047 [Fusarium solani]